MTAEGKITTTAITQQASTKPGVRILVTQDPNTGALDYTYRKTGAVAVLVTGYATVAGSRQCRYQLQTSAGTLTCAPSQTHWLARDKDKDALPAIAFDACSQCSAGHADEDGRCSRHGKTIATERTAPDTPGDPAATTPHPDRFSAGWSNGEVTVIRDVHAGISGPFGDYPAADLEEAEKVLRANGYALSGPWSEHANGHFAPLALVPVERTDPDRPASTRAPLTIVARHPQAADGSTRYDLSNGWFVMGETHHDRRHFRDHRYSAYAPGASPDGFATAVGTGGNLDRLVRSVDASIRPVAVSTESSAPEGGTFEHQASTDGGKMWRTVAVGLSAADVDAYRAANESGEGASWRMLPEGDDRARAIAAKAAELTAARTRFYAECDRPLGGRSRTKQFGRRADAQLRRAGELRRLVDRLSGELDALRRPVRVVPPLDLERLPYATHIRTDAGWYEVVKVNRKSVKVKVDPGWDDLIPIKRVKEIHVRVANADPDAPAGAGEQDDSDKTPPAEVEQPKVFVSGWATIDPVGPVGA